MSVETVHLSVPLISPAPSSVVSVTLAPGFRGAALLLDWPLCRDAADADAADAAVKSHSRSPVVLSWPRYGDQTHVGANRTRSTFICCVLYLYSRRYQGDDVMWLTSG